MHSHNKIPDDCCPVSSILLIDGRASKCKWALEFEQAAADIDDIIMGKVVPVRFVDNTSDIPSQQHMFRIEFEKGALGLEGDDGIPSVDIVKYCLRICGIDAQIGSDEHSTIYNDDGSIQELPVTVLDF